MQFSSFGIFQNDCLVHCILKTVGAKKEQVRDESFLQASFESLLWTRQVSEESWCREIRIKSPFILNHLWHSNQCFYCPNDPELIWQLLIVHLCKLSINGVHPSLILEFNSVFFYHKVFTNTPLKPHKMGETVSAFELMHFVEKCRSVKSACSPFFSEASPVCLLEVVQLAWTLAFPDFETFLFVRSSNIP